MEWADRAVINVLIPIGGLACNVFVQVASLRLAVRPSLLRSIYRGFGVGAGGVCAAQWLAHGPRGFAWDLAANLVIYGILGYCYFHFLNLGETGRRVRLVRELHDSPDGLTLEEIVSRYNGAQIVSMRLRRLLENGKIVEKDGRYRLGRLTMARIATLIMHLKMAILGRRSEFELGE